MEPQEMPEVDVLKDCLTYLRYHSEVSHVKRETVGLFRTMTGNRYVTIGFEGLADITGMLCDGRFLAVETKRLSGEARDKQAAFLRQVAKHGGVAILARSLEFLEEAMRGKHGNPAGLDS